MEKPTEGKCVVCKGQIVEMITSEFNPKFGSLIIGPGSKEQFHEVSQGFHCKKCGLKYAFVPMERNKPIATIRSQLQ